MKGELICAVCPVGCHVTAEWNETDLLDVQQAACKLAWPYIRSEIFDPRRVVTSSVPVVGGEIPLVSVKTDSPVPKDRMRDVMQSLAQVTVQAPVNVGDVVVSNILGLGANIRATKRIKKVS
ncbi:MAG: DUF1667 domain-containing protein [Chloroflexi bacterium]|nr:DUF1667 domain-containing protein [Chloroflexota bacterium]